MNQSPAVTHKTNTESPHTAGRPGSAYDKQSRIQAAVRWFRHKMSGREGSIKEMLEEALEEESDHGLRISDEEKNLLKNMIHFGELTVRDIMVPRTEIMALPRSAGFDELKRHVIEIGHTRIPVYDESLDKIEGFLHVKDLFPHLAAETAPDMKTLLRAILFVPPSMRIVDLLLKMRVSGCHIAIVVDEYGGTTGMVTMEDLFEEIVGEIQDEHDAMDEESLLRTLSDHVWEADARLPIEKLEETLGEPLRIADDEGEDYDYDTLGGLIFAMLGRVPVKGEVVMVRPHYKIEIQSADPRRIKHVRITRVTDAA